jgi:hypothetical protein
MLVAEATIFSIGRDACAVAREPAAVDGCRCSKQRVPEISYYSIDGGQI